MAEIKVAASPWQRAKSGLAPQRRILAVGDAHGMSKQLEALLDHLEDDLAGDENSLLIFIGDLIDRGEDSIGCLDLAINAENRAFGDVIHLMGNHEQMLRLFLEGKSPGRPVPLGNYDDSLELYLFNGGGKLLCQLGVSEYYEPCQVAKKLREALGQDRMEFLEGLSRNFREGNLLFVHAGICLSESREAIDAFLEKSWDELSDDHWLWIRYPFLSKAVKVPELIVVHGHTRARIGRPVGRELHRPHLLHQGKINIDGGSNMSGCVTAVDFSTEGYRIIVAHDSDAVVREPAQRNLRDLFRRR